MNTFKTGDRVRIGKGKIVWTITSFFGEHKDIAALQRPDFSSSNTSAHTARLKSVKA